MGRGEGCSACRERVRRRGGGLARRGRARRVRGGLRRGDRRRRCLGRSMSPHYSRTRERRTVRAAVSSLGISSIHASRSGLRFRFERLSRRERDGLEAWGQQRSGTQWAGAVRDARSVLEVVCVEVVVCIGVRVIALRRALLRGGRGAWAWFGALAMATAASVHCRAQSKRHRRTLRPFLHRRSSDPRRFLAARCHPPLEVST